MKLRIIVLMLCGVAGAWASFAFAEDGRGHRDAGPCDRAVVFGAVSAPQSFTVTVTKQWWQSTLTPGQTVKVAVGSTGQNVRFAGVGCLGADGTLTVREAELHVVQPRPSGDGPAGTTTTKDGTTSTSTPSTTTTNVGTTTTR